MSSPKRVNLAKHLEHGGIFFCSFCGIWWRNVKTFHLASIISVSLSSVWLYFPTYRISDFPVAKTGISLDMQTSAENWFFGEGKCSVSPSSNKRRSFQLINSADHLKSFKNMTSELSDPTHAYLSFAVLLNALNIFCNGLNMNDLAQLAGPQMIMLLNFPHPFSSNSLSEAA